MKNNKGMVLSIYIYILLVFFLLILSTMLMVLNNTKLLATKMKNNSTNILIKYDLSIVLLGKTETVIQKGVSYTDAGYVAQTKSGKSITATATTNLNINTVGTYTYTYTVKYADIEKSVTRTIYVIDGNYSYTGAAQTFTVPATGYYKVELWGASSITDTYSGYGGYTKGIIFLNKNEVLNIYVGGKGVNALSGTATGGYNGGGNAYQSSDGNAASGGGATDIRYGGTSLNDRIMVAGGAGYVVNVATTYGYGGFLVGSTGTSSTYIGTGGTQIGGGTGTVAGSFGQGANGSASSFRAGGGGGYYGGGVSGIASGSAAGGGGSSFISGYAGTNAIIDTNPVTVSNNTIHNSGKYFIYGDMLTGVRIGDGAAKITYMSDSDIVRINTSLNGVRYIKDCINGSSFSTYNNWVEVQAIYNGTNVAYGKNVSGTSSANASYPYSRITDGDITTENYAQTDSTGLQCITVDLNQSYNLDEISIWHKWLDGRTYNNNVTYVSSDNSNWTSVIANSAAETSQGKRVSAYGSYSSSGLTTYSLTNLISGYISSFENTGWGSCTYSTTYRKYGSYSCSLTGTTSIAEITTTSSAVLSTALDNTHIYYARVEGYQTSQVGEDVEIYWPIAEPKFGAVPLKAAGSWQLYSYLVGKSTFTNGTYQVRVDYDNVNLAGVMYYDGVMIIDLTATFGAGHEPNKTWCDTYIPFIVMTQNLKLPTL